MKKWMSFALSVLMMLGSFQLVQAAGSEGSAGEVLARDYFQQISSISEELEDGSVIINGINAQGQRVSGWMYADGSFEVCKEFTALYPLAGGNVLAVTEDVDSSPLDLSEGGIAVSINEAGVHGKILNAEGKVLYEQDKDAPDQKLYRIDENHVLVLSAHVEDGEVVLEAGELDAEGQWILPLSSKLPHQSRLESYLEPQMDPDGYHWSLADQGSRFCYKGVNYQNGKSSTLQFVDCSEPGKDISTARQNFNITFSTKMNTFLLLRAPVSEEKDYAFFDEISDEVYVFRGSSQNENAGGLTFMSTKATDTLFDDTTEPVEVLGSAEVNGSPVMVYWSPSEKSIYTVKLSETIEGEMRPSALSLDPSMVGQIGGTPVLNGEQIALVTTSNENDPYSSALTLVDLGGNVLQREAISNLPVHSKGVLSEEVLVLQDQESGSLRVVDLNEKKLAFVFECEENQTFSDPRILFDKYVTFRVEEEEEVEVSFFGMFGGKKEIQKKTYYYLMDPEVEIPYSEPWVQLWDIPMMTEHDNYSQVLTELEMDPSNNFRRGMAYGTLYDLNDDGILEMVLMYHKTVYGEGEIAVVDVYTMMGGKATAYFTGMKLCTEVAAQHGILRIMEKDGQKILVGEMKDSYDDSANTHFYQGNRWTYVFGEEMSSMTEYATYYYEELPGSTEINPAKTRVTINFQRASLEDYNRFYETHNVILDHQTNFLSYMELYNATLEMNSGNASSQESSEETSYSENVDESSEESVTEESSISSGLTYFSDDELVSYSWDRRATANAKWDGQGEIPNGTEYLGQIHFTRDDGTYINYVVFRQYGIFKGQYNSFIWWGRRGSLSGMMEARDSGLLWQCPGLSSYYSYYGVANLTEFYNYMLINELNKGYTAAYCDVDGLPL